MVRSESPWYCVNQFSTLILCKCVVLYASQSADWPDYRQGLSYMWLVIFVEWTIGPVGRCTFGNTIAHAFCTQRSVSPVQSCSERVFDHRFQGWWIFRCGPQHCPLRSRELNMKDIVCQQKVETHWYIAASHLGCCNWYKEQSYRSDKSCAPDSQTRRDIYQHSVNDKSVTVENWTYIYLAFLTGNDIRLPS